MKKILHEIHGLPGVTGTCVINKGGNLIFTELPASFLKEKVQNVWHHFSRLIQMASLYQLEIGSISYRYNKYIVLVIPLTTEIMLLIICSPQSNCSLITTIATMLSDDITKALSKIDNDYKIGKPRKSLPQKPDTIAPQDKNSSVDIDATISAALRVYIDKLKDLLTQYMGPFSAVIIPDSVNKWTSSGPPSSDRLSYLVDILAEELDGENKNRFLSEAREII